MKPILSVYGTFFLLGSVELVKKKTIIADVLFFVCQNSVCVLKIKWEETILGWVYTL